MPLNRPALSLGPGPRSVQDARRWVVDACHDIGRADLTECAELVVSELVTNALLHARPPYEVRVRGTREHPRVEVCDGSAEPPPMPAMTPPDAEDFLVTFGRGLGVVASCAAAWGVHVEEDGKTVWFVPAVRPGSLPAAGVVTGESAAPTPVPAPDDIRVHLVGVPVRSFVEFQRHARELRREVRLLSLAHGTDYPLAATLTESFAALARDLRDGVGADQVEQAQLAGARHTDLHLAAPRTTAATIAGLVDLLDLADRFCREERLLALARTPEQRRFQAWFLGEFVRQERGEAPLAWQDAPVSPARSSLK